MNTQIIRCISILLTGVLFLVLGDSALSLLITIVGILFMVPGVVSLVAYYLHRPQYPIFPFAALGSFLLGLWLTASPSFFISVFMYVLGGTLVALSVYQLAILVTSSRMLPVAWPFYLSPVLVLLLGLFVIFNPFEAASLPFTLVGIGCLFSAFNDMVSIYRDTRSKQEKATRTTIEDAEIVK